MYWLKDEIPDLVAKKKKKSNVAWERNGRRKKKERKNESSGTHKGSAFDTLGIFRKILTK